VNERKIEKKTKEVYLTYISDRVKPSEKSANIKFAFDVENFKISSIKQTKLSDGMTVYSVQGEGDMIHKTLNENNNAIVMQKKYHSWFRCELLENRFGDLSYQSMSISDKNFDKN